MRPEQETNKFVQPNGWEINVPNLIDASNIASVPYKVFLILAIHDRNRQENKGSPDLREIAEFCRYASTSTVSRRLTQLAELGFINVEYHQPKNPGEEPQMKARSTTIAVILESVKRNRGDKIIKFNP